MPLGVLQLAKCWGHFISGAFWGFFFKNSARSIITEVYGIYDSCIGHKGHVQCSKQVLQKSRLITSQVIDLTSTTCQRVAEQLNS